MEIIHIYALNGYWRIISNPLFGKSMQLDEAERRLEDSQIKLVRLRSQANVMSSKIFKRDGLKSTKVERRSSSRIQISEDSASPPHQAHSKPKLVIPAANVKKYQATKPSEPSPKASTLSGSRSSTSTSTRVNSIVKVKREKSYRISSEQETLEVEAKGTKRKLGNSQITYHYQFFLFLCVFNIFVWICISIIACYLIFIFLF